MTTLSLISQESRQAPNQSKPAALEFLGQGTALPEHWIGQEESIKYVIDYFCETDEERVWVPILYDKVGVKRRYSVLLRRPEGEADRHPEFPPPTTPSDEGPSVGYRMRLYERECAPLALRASRQALDQSGVRAEAITHVITVSCSGFFAPGVDIALIKGLGLPATAQRTHVGFMGCYAAINGLRVAQGFAGCNPDARILVCAVELCSLHYRYGKQPEYIVANAIFSDGAAAVVVAPQQHPGGWCVTDTGSCLIPDSEDAMTWRIYDHGFMMTLSKQVPQLIGTYLPGWLNSWLGKNGLTQDDVKTWAVHPGGPRILTAVADALGLPRETMRVSLDVLCEHGNMSSPTILFVLDRLRRQNAPRPCVALGFGPGLMAEAMLFA